MRLTIAAVGRLRGGPLAEAFADYAGRLKSGRWTLDMVEVEERRRLSGPELVAREGELLLAAIPRGADVLLLKHVLHNWDDERAATLLQRCAEALPAGGRLLVIETILAPDNRADLAAMLDLEMMVLLGGRERRKPELRRMLSACGLSLLSMAPLVSGSWLLVAEKRAAG